MRRERRNGVIMSESYAVNEKRELILQKVKEFIVAHGGIVKKNQLEELHIDYRRILDFVEKGDLIRIKSGYYTIRIGDYSEDELIVKLFPDAEQLLYNRIGRRFARDNADFATRAIHKRCDNMLCSRAKHLR